MNARTGNPAFKRSLTKMSSWMFTARSVAIR